MYATILSSSSSCVFPTNNQNVTKVTISSLRSVANINLSKSSGQVCCWAARRQVRYEEDYEEEHNEEIAVLEFYTQLAKDEALLVNALVDDQQLHILVFKGFSSNLSSGTCFDPTRSILPARAVIQSIDRVKGPFNPSNIDYIEKNLHVEAFKTVVQKIKDVRSNLQS